MQPTARAALDEGAALGLYSDFPGLDLYLPFGIPSVAWMPNQRSATRPR
jgi:hypothetical protein